MLKGSLTLKLIVPLVAVIALLAAAVVHVGGTMMENALSEPARRRARSLSVIERDNIQNLMRAGDHRNLQALLEQHARNPDVEVLRVLPRRERCTRPLAPTRWAGSSRIT